MSDSNITKRALAVSLRALMEEHPFEKINVAQICDRCCMNRKSFYYHFKDKYDLVNWIFNTDLISLAVSEVDVNDNNSLWQFLERLGNYFYENRAFYRSAFQIKGQNSFSDHFREFTHPLFKDRLAALVGEENVDEFILDFLSDATLSAVERWLTAKECVPPGQLIERLRFLVQKSTAALREEAAQNPAFWEKDGD
ncbi:MAG: TetR/AcrR family transcriptional regulator C-terminal domain-containing protein [Clostridiales bacterium]|nr:TetR/AcrR family transcriptional regulator C-terminal domain-containing protein [Clostridiales bacterium]